MNSVFVIGRITKDPELNHTKGGTAYCRFSVAVDRDRERELVDFIPVTCWGNTAVNVSKYVIRGQQLAIQGNIKTGKYTDNDGKDRYTTDVIAERVEFLSKPKGEQDHNNISNSFTPVDNDDELPF